MGAVVVLLAVSGYTTTIAGNLGSETAVELTSDAAGAGDGTTFPITAVSVNGEPYTLLGVPTTTSQDIAVPNGVAGPLSGRTVTIAGEQTTLERGVVKRSDDTPFPDSWLITDASTARELGADRALVIRESSDPVPQSGAPLIGALAFFIAGTQQVLGLLTVVCAGAAVLIGVIIFSVTRMTVRERRETLRVLRATGATQRTVLMLVAARAGLLTLIGIALGYAFGVIIPNAAANIAITLGFPIGLPMAMSAQTALVVAGMLGALVCVGILAGGLAGRQVVSGEPLDVKNNSSRRWPGGPSFLPSGAVVPTTATLAVFIAFVLVVFSLGGVVGSVGATDQQGGTIVAPNAVHPVASQVDVAYAEALQRAGTAASPEILLFQVSDGHPFPARGVQFDAYQNVTDAKLVAGRAPNATDDDEAVIGTDLATTLGVGPGDELALGGSTKAGVATVEIVGTFSASGAADDHLLVSLPVARHLSTVRQGKVNLIRLADRPQRGARGGVAVLDVSTPRQVVAGEQLPVRVQVRNVGQDTTTETLRATFGSQEQSTQISLTADQQRTVTFRFTAEDPGTQTIRVGETNQSVRVVTPTALRLSQVPKTAPPNATFELRVTTATGQSVSNATVTLGDRSVGTTPKGRARVQLPTADGTYSLRVVAGNRSVSRQLRVNEDVQRTPTVQLSMVNETGVLTAPTARVRVSNPWSTPQTASVSVSGPGATVNQAVRLAPGASKAVAANLERRPPGTYTVEATVNGTTIEQQYRVTGDERLASAIASSGRVSGGVGTSGFIARAFGNIGLVLATLLGLGVVMTVGSTIASFADAVQARRRDIGVHRAVGAGPLQVGKLVLSDALRIAIPAGLGGALLAVITLTALSWAGALTVFGVQLAPQAPLALIGGIVLGALGLALVSAVMVVARYVRADPSRLFGGSQ
ncbi:FtsX-like permease family protein [Halomarina salina]|uniref:FtsX-like permease family protein n=1 Tax=Halomarina salina TaxID=1872699 RepID=A0ABD5RS80_9EURY|nr:FtsX-like permease family protein [Halomarina salina]